MCGIVLVPDTPEYSQITASTRGPDATSIYCLEIGGVRYQLRFYRLEVYGGDDGAQPLESHRQDGGKQIFACNGEIYNWKELNREMETDIKGDCLVAAKAISHYGWKEAIEKLLGEFALINIRTGVAGKPDKIVIARDRFGVRPMYIGSDSENRFLAVSSLLGVPKELTHLFYQMPGGTWKTVEYSDSQTVRINSGNFNPPPYPPLARNRSDNFRELFLYAVRVRCQQISEDQKIGVLLSGGMDSVAVLAAMCECINPKQIVAFTISFDSYETPDVNIAGRVCAELGVGRHEIVVINDDPPNIMKELKRAIRVLHTYDTTTIRAGTIQNMLYKQAADVMKEEGIKALLSGEGSDELAGGYQYFKMAPDAIAADRESERLLNEIYMYDGLRADRTSGAWGKEIRLPFLDTNVTQAYKMYWASTERWNRKIEKKNMRELLAGFDLPSFTAESVMAAICRPKDALSDSVGKRWVERLKAMASEYSFVKHSTWKYFEPRTNEEMMYRTIFDEVCGAESFNQIPGYWMPQWQPDGSHGSVDPSATVLECFTES